jgi:MFS family permease
MREKMNSRERRTVLFLGVSHALTHSMMLTFPAILIPLMKEFHLDLFGVGLLGNIGYLLYGMGALPAGLLADRWGARRVLISFLLGSTLACLLIFLSRGLMGMALGFLVAGAAAGLYHPAGLSYLTQAVRLRGKALGYHGMSGNIGLAVAPALAGWVAVSVGWRWDYLILSFMFGLVAILGWRSTFWLDTGLGEGVEEVVEEGSNEDTARVPLLFLYIIMVFSGFIYRGYLTYLPTYLSMGAAGGGRWELSVRGAGFVTSAALGLGVFGQWLGGHLSQRYRLELLGLSVILSAVPFLFLTSFASGGMLIAATSLFIFFYFGWQPVGNGLIAKYTPQRLRSLGFGISFTLSFGAGSFASSVAGYIGEYFGLNRVFLFLSVLLSIVFFLSVALMRLAGPRRRIVSKQGVLGQGGWNGT